MHHIMLSSLVLALSAGLPASVEPQNLLEQPLASVEDTCDSNNGVRRVRSATFGPRGEVEDKIELRTTTRNAASVTMYVVNDVVVFTDRPGEATDVTPAGIALLSNETPAGSARAVKLLAAFAALQARVFAADVDAPQHSCGMTRGKAEEQGKCALIGVIGCLPPAGAVTCGISALLAVGCNYLVEKACEAEPDTCQPGWTEG